MKLNRWPCLLHHSFISELEGDFKEPSTLLLERKGEVSQLVGSTFSSVITSFNIQLSPEGEVNSGGLYRDAKRRGIYLAL